MRIEKVIDRTRVFLLWIYTTVLLSGLIYAASKGQTIRTPGDIIYEKTQTAHRVAVDIHPK